MMKNKRDCFVCQKCQQRYVKWHGQCYSCKDFNTIEIVTETLQETAKADVKLIKDVNCNQNYFRILTGIGEFDTVMGGGILADSVILLSGSPGIGKSTLLLEIVCRVAKQKRVLYISTEESESQIKIRLDRLEYKNQNWYICQETLFEIILSTISSFDCDMVVIDSLGNIKFDKEYSGCHIQQIKNILHTLVEHAKENHYILFITGHVTKDGEIAGPKVLEHLVDVVLYLEVLEESSVRILRTTKNRFGSTNEVGFLEMTEKGLLEYTNPQDIFIENNVPAIGSALTWMIEGSRSFLIEIQTLLNKTRNNTPIRVTYGIDNKQFILLCAVIEKYLKIPLYEFDIFSKIAHNYKMKLPHIDLAIVISILSSYYNQKINNRILYHGEVCLSGRINAKYNINEKLPILKYGINKIVSGVFSEGDKKNTVDIVIINSIYQIVALFENLK